MLRRVVGVAGVPPPANVDLWFADPPYDIKKAYWDNFESHESYVEWSGQWVELAARALKKTGTLYVCGFSEILADIKVAAMPHFRSCRWLVWHYKNKANLGGDWGRSHESILHLRKTAEFTINVEDVRIPCDKTNFTALPQYIAHTQRYLDFIGDPQRVQAVIVSQNEPYYRFLQYKKDGGFNVTRPLNSHLLYSASAFASVLPRFLDSLPAGQSNTARKINGDLFERLIQLILVTAGVDCTEGTVYVPVAVPGIAEFKMRFQHELIIKAGELVKMIGSVKTSSKDRLGKIFVDKFLLHRMTGKDVPHVAIFLNDVQRKGVLPRFGINSTFLSGPFKGYTIKLNPLDGVYHCDIRLTASLLKTLRTPNAAGMGPAKSFPMLQRPRDCHHCVAGSCPHRCWQILNEHRNVPPLTLLRKEPRTPLRPRCFMEVRRPEYGRRLL